MYILTRAGIALIDAYLHLTVADPEERDRRLLAYSEEYLKAQSEDGKAERPLKYLRKYLAGDDSPELVDLFELQAEDKGVRRSIHDQVLGFLAQHELFHKTGIDSSRSGRFTHMASTGAGKDPESYRMLLDGRKTKALTIGVGQSDFSVRDWCNAIGSFTLEWKLVNVRSGGSASLVYLSGTNRYRWHPELPRQSQRVHQAAERLKEFGAREFDIVFKPCVLTVTGKWQKLS